MPQKKPKAVKERSSGAGYGRRSGRSEDKRSPKERGNRGASVRDKFSGGRAETQGSGRDLRRQSSAAAPDGGGSAAGGRDLLSGKNAVISRMESGGSINQIWLSDTLRRDSRLQTILDLAARMKVKYQFVARRVLDELTGDEDHQGVVADIPPYAYLEFETLLTTFAGRGTGSLLIAMDGIEDPHNAGAIIRSAVAAGADAVIMPKHRNVQLTQTVSRASAGAIERISVAKTVNLSQALSALKEAGFWIYGLAGEEDSEDWNSQTFPEKTVLVVGNEGKGLGPLVRKHCDVLLKIPMRNGTESLNASVSAALMMYKIQEKRGII